MCSQYVTSEAFPSVPSRKHSPNVLKRIEIFHAFFSIFRVHCVFLDDILYQNSLNMFTQVQEGFRLIAYCDEQQNVTFSKSSVRGVKKLGHSSIPKLGHRSFALVEKERRKWTTIAKQN